MRRQTSHAQMKWDEMKNEPWWNQSELRASTEMKWQKMQWDHLRWGMWQIERPLLRSTEGFGVTFRHSLCSALHKRFNFETSAPQHAQVLLVENLRGKNGDISPPILLSMRKRQHLQCLKSYMFASIQERNQGLVNTSSRASVIPSLRHCFL